MNREKENKNDAVSKMYISSTLYHSYIDFGPYVICMDIRSQHNMITMVNGVMPPSNSLCGKKKGRTSGVHSRA